MKKTNKRITKVAKSTRVKKAAKKSTTKTAKRLTKAKPTTKNVVAKKPAMKSTTKKPAIKMATKPMAVKSMSKKTTSKSATKKQVGAPAQIDSQYNVILNHLVKNGSINTMEAIKKYGVLRLGAVVFDLRQGGMDIKTSVHTFSNKSGRKSNVAKYILQS